MHPHATHASFGPPDCKSQTASPSVQPVQLNNSRQNVLILYNGPPSSPLKIAPCHGDLDLHLIHYSFGPSEPITQMASRLVQPFLHGSMLWQTDHSNRFVKKTGRIYIRTMAMWPNNKSTCISPGGSVLVKKVKAFHISQSKIKGQWLTAVKYHTYYTHNNVVALFPGVYHSYKLHILLPSSSPLIFNRPSWSGQWSPHTGQGALQRPLTSAGDLL